MEEWHVTVNVTLFNSLVVCTSLHLWKGFLLFYILHKAFATTKFCYQKCKLLSNSFTREWFHDICFIKIEIKRKQNVWMKWKKIDRKRLVMNLYRMLLFSLSFSCIYCSRQIFWNFELPKIFLPNHSVFFYLKAQKK